MAEEPETTTKGIAGMSLPENEAGPIHWRIPNDKELPIIIISTFRESMLQQASVITGYAELLVSTTDPDLKAEYLEVVLTAGDAIQRQGKILNNLQTLLQSNKKRSLPIRNHGTHDIIDITTLEKHLIHPVPQTTTSKRS